MAFFPTGPSDPPEESSLTHCSAGEDVVGALIVLDAVPLFARALPPTAAQEEGVGDFPLANGKPMLYFVPGLDEGGVDDLVELDADQIY